MEYVVTAVAMVPQKRKVKLSLALGILIFPSIFGWFLFRKGHSTLARVLGFPWLALGLMNTSFFGYCAFQAFDSYKHKAVISSVQTSAFQGSAQFLLSNIENKA
jgi:hypothetical protein